MTAILIPTGSEAEWLAARRQGITASEIAIVMGLSPYSSPFALYHQKLGQLPQQADNVEMALGRYLEGFVVNEFEKRSGLFTWGSGRELYACAEQSWQLATPDRLLTEGRSPDCPVAVLETKTDAGYDGWGEDGSDEIPVHYRCQVLWQMDVMGVGAGYVACLFLHSRTLRVYELAMDADAQADLKIMRDAAQCFLDDIRDGTEPDVDWRPPTRNALKILHPSVEDRTATIPRTLASRYRAACKAVKAAERRKALAENQIRQRMGSAQRAVEHSVYVPDGAGHLIERPVATRQVYDLAEKTITRRGCTVDKLVPAKPKEKS